MKKKKQTHYYKPSAESAKLSTTQKTIIGIIIAVMAIVAIAVACAFAFKTENIVKSKIEYLAKDYYENYLYEKYTTPKETAKSLAEYETTGLVINPLRQIIYHGGADASDIKLIRDTCDENKTYIKYYPEPPYTKTSYRVEYTYNCNF